MLKSAAATQQPQQQRGVWRSALEFRTEIVGHTTLCMLSLMGLCLYSFTYSFTYLATRSKSVAVLEMWAVYTHLFCSVGTCCAQILLSAMFGLVGGLPKIAEAQSSLFLGMALAITCIGSVCLADGHSIECAAFYPAAVSPSLAAAGSVAWTWVMYLASLGCQSAELTLSLGIGSLGGLIVAAAMACVQPPVVQALVQKCRSSSIAENSTAPTGTKWDTLLSASAVDGIDTTVTLNALFLFAGLILGAIGAVLTDKVNPDRRRRGLNAVGVFFKMLGCISLSANAILSYSFPPLDAPSFRWLMALFAIVPIISPMFSKLGRSTAAAADAGDETNTEDEAVDEADDLEATASDAATALLPQQRRGGGRAARTTGANLSMPAFLHNTNSGAPYLRNSRNFAA